MVIDTACFGQIRDIKDIEKAIDDLSTSDISAVRLKFLIIFLSYA